MFSMRISRQRRSVAGRTIRAVAPASPRRELYLPRTSFLPVGRLRDSIKRRGLRGFFRRD